MENIVERSDNELLKETVEVLSNVLLTLLLDLHTRGVITEAHKDFIKLVHEQRKVVKD